MPPQNVILEKVQAGFETVRGTGVAATRLVYAQVAPSYERSLQTFVDTTGTFHARRRAAYGRQAVGFAVTDIATYEDLAWWLQMAMKGGVAGVSDAGTPAGYAYTFQPSTATDDLKSATFEFNAQGNVYESTQVMCNSFTLRGDSDSNDEPGWMFEGELVGRDWATTTYTGSIADRDTEVITARGTKLYVDDASIGTSQVTARLISWSITGNNNLQMGAYAEDENSFAANAVIRGEVTYDAQLVLAFNSDAEFDDYRASAPVLRHVRLEREGTTIHTTVKNRLRFDMNGYWSTISWGERNGERIATFGLSCYYNPTSGFAAKAAIVNDLSALA